MKRAADLYIDRDLSQITRLKGRVRVETGRYAYIPTGDVKITRLKGRVRVETPNTPLIH